MKSLLRVFLMTGLVAGFFFSMSGAAVARTLTLADLRKEVTLADPQISPDGSRVALLVGHNDFEHDTLPAHIVMVDVARGGMHELPVPQTDIAFVRWSPHGDWLAYLAGAEGGPKQLYIISPSRSRAR